MPRQLSPLPARALCALLSASTLILGSATLRADVPPVWKRDFAEPIAWQHVTALGQLLVATANGLYSIDPESGEPLWSRPDLSRLPAQGLRELAGSPLVLITDGAQNSRTVILNALNGSLTFDSRAEKLTGVAATHVLTRSGSLLVAGFEAQKPEPTLFLYNIDDGKRLWSSNALAVGGNPLMNLLLSAAIVALDVSPVQSEPLELPDGTFILGAMGNLYRFEQASGKVVWKTPFAGGQFEFRQPEQRPGVVYVGAEEVQKIIEPDETTRERVSTLYQGFTLSDGKPLWKRPVQFGNRMNRLIIPLERGLLVSDGDSDKGKVQLLDYDTGAPQWGNRARGVEISGMVVAHAFTDAGLILITGYDSVWTNKDTEYLLYVLDSAAGAFRFEEPLKVKGRMLATELTDRGLIYVTTHEVNVFDPATGALVTAPVLRTKKPLVTVDEARIVYAFNSDDGFVYRFDRDTAEISKFSRAPFELVDRDEARALDVVDGRVVLTGQQTVAGFDADGALAFNAHYRAPRDPAWVRSLAWATAIRAGMASAYAGAYSAAFASAAGDAQDGSLGQAMAEELHKGFGELQQGYQGLASDYAQFARRRYQASAEARDFVFMMVQHEDRRVSLAQVSKLDGRIVGEIGMQGDKEPSYEVDDIGNLLFYRPSPSTITTYRFSPQRLQVARP